MYRIAVIQNEVEMQHCGYADVVPKYKEWDFFDEEEEKAEYYIFTSDNVRKLFVFGENNLLTFDCLIIGTNATSDANVYNVFREEQSKKLLEKYISKGKGLLICSQKKFRSIEIENKYKSNEQNGNDKAPEKPKNKTLRQSFILPTDYEYKVRSRNEIDGDNAKSSEGHAHIYKSKDINIIQDFLLAYPCEINDEQIEKQCRKNEFQAHFYRDFIEPNNSSSYLPLVVDDTNTNDINDTKTNHADTGDTIKDKTKWRNILMVAVPRDKERIVISTMALDWAGHKRLLKNIVYYLVKGIPTVAIIDKDKSPELDTLVDEIEKNKLFCKKYNSLSKLNEKNNKLKKYHSIYVFEPKYSEKEVIEQWNSLDKKKKYQLLFFKKDDSNTEGKPIFVLQKLSSFGFIDRQKNDIYAWLRSEYKDGFWGESFWKTFDVLLGLRHMDEEQIKPFLKNTFAKIKKHTKNGSYDGVLATTCGLFELESIVRDSENKDLKQEVPDIEFKFNDTKKWLLDIFNEKESNNTNGDYNKKVIVRSFYSSGHEKDLIYKEGEGKNDRWDSFIKNLTPQKPSSDTSDIELCLDIEVFLDCLDCIKDKEPIYDYINRCIDELLSKNRYLNGKWDDNIGKTARIILFLQKIKKKMESLNGFEEKDKIINKITGAINEGIRVLKSSYKDDGNWENNVVTTANALAVLYEDSQNKDNDVWVMQDLMRQIGQEISTSDSYNSLKLALETIDNLNKNYGKVNEELKEYRDDNARLTNKNKELEKEIKELEFNERVYLMIHIIMLLFILAGTVFVASKHMDIFLCYIKDNLLLVSSIVITIILTSLVMYHPKWIRFINNLKNLHCNKKNK